MQMMKGWALCLLICPFLACTSLKPIQLFSEEALKGLQQFHELDYSFTKSCRDDCLFTRISQYEIERSINCGCSEYERADTLVRELYHALTDYYDGLHRLSSGELIRYELEGTAAVLEGANWNQLEPEQLNAYQKLSEIGLNAVAGKYRKNKVTQYMHEADPHIMLISEKLQFIIKENLLGMLEIQKESWYMYYKTQAIDPGLNSMEKELVTEKYYQLLDQGSRIREKTLVLIRILETLSSQHRALSAMKLNGDFFEDGVRSMTNRLNDLHYSLEQLKQ